MPPSTISTKCQLASKSEKVPVTTAATAKR